MKYFIQIGLLVGFLSGCGGDYFDAYLRSGEELPLGKTRRISSSGDLSSSSCVSFDGSEVYDCIEKTSIFVGLPSNISYAGDPEVVYGVTDFLFGETNLEEPIRFECGQRGVRLQFQVPEDRLDTESESEGIVTEIGDDLFDVIVREFRFDVRGESTSDNVPIYIKSVPEGMTLSCAEIFSGSPQMVVKVGTSEN